MHVWSEQERAQIIKRIVRVLPAYEAATPRCEGRWARGHLSLIPLGLVTLGFLGALEIDAQGLFKPDLPVAPLMLAAIAARMFGRRAARVAAALVAPILVYAMHSNFDGDLDDFMWAAVHFGGLIALSVSAKRLPGIGPPRRTFSARAAGVTVGWPRSSEFAG